MKSEFTLDAREFTQAMREYVAVSKKDEKEAVADRAGKLSWTLWNKFSSITPSIQFLKSLPKALGYRIRRDRGMTVDQEIKRRIAARRAAASGWIPAVQRFSRRGTAIAKKAGKGSFEINLNEPSVTISNEMKQAFIAEEKHQLLQQAVDAQTEDMRVYIEQRLDRRARQFSAR